MQFDNASFWLFFVVAWCTWRFLPFASAKIAALSLSLCFYAWWNPLYLVLIVASAVIDFTAGSRIAAAAKPSSRRLWLIVSLCTNLGLLGFFKYTPFLAGNLQYLGDWLGVDWSFRVEGWVIPVGISFYTFQTLSYTIDVYRQRIDPVDRFTDFFLYVSFFPQLVAGPIVRAKTFLPQIARRRRVRLAMVQAGVYAIVWGLFMKMVVADTLAMPVDQNFDPEGVHNLSPAGAWLGVLYFSVQIFADFAGYSSIAIGLGHLMGLRFPRNFRYPYISAGLSEFWTRWHISLSQWLRDYLYIPLGGNRGGSGFVYRNLMITMLLGGLWHGASWTFVAWGGLHGFGLCVERVLRRGRPPRQHDHRFDGRISWIAALRKLVAIGVVFVFVQVTWVFFRADSFSMAWQYLERMFVAPLSEPVFGRGFTTPFLLMVFPVALFHAGQLLHEWFGFRQTSALKAAAVGAMGFALLVVTRPEEHAFIYFQF